MKKSVILFLFIILLHINSNAQELSWETVAPLPAAHMSGTAIVCEDNIYYIGGLSADENEEGSNVNFAYDPLADSWQRKANLPTRRWNFASAAVNGKIFCIGGDSFLNKNEMYDPAEDQWAEKAPMPTPRQHISGISFGNKIYILGGLESWEKVSSKNEVFDPTTNMWIERKPMPIPKHNYSAVVYNKKIYVFGGSTQKGKNIWIPSSSIEVYDPGEDSWETFSQMPAGLSSAGIVLLKKHIVFFGGYKGTEVTNNVAVFSPETNTWFSDHFLPKKNVSMGAVVFNDKLFIIGGSGGPEETPGNSWKPYDSVYKSEFIVKK